MSIKVGDMVKIARTSDGDPRNLGKIGMVKAIRDERVYIEFREKIFRGADDNVGVLKNAYINRTRLEKIIKNSIIRNA